MSVWQDIEDDGEESKNYSKKEKAFDEVSYRYNLRVKLVGFARTDCRSMMNFIRENEKAFRTAGYDDTAKEEMRRTIDECFSKSPFVVSKEDRYVCDSIFGPVRPSRPRFVSTETHRDKSPFELSFPEQIAWFANTTYDNFWKWIILPETQESAIKMPELKWKLKLCIEDNVRLNRNLFKNRKEYEPEDDIVFKKILDSIPDIKGGIA